MPKGSDTTCLSCGGEYFKHEDRDDGTYKIVRCPWCTKGLMSVRQQAAFMAFKFRKGTAWRRTQSKK